MATRAWARGEAFARLATPLTDAGMANDDSPGNMKEPLDDALFALGYKVEELTAAEPSDAMGFLALTKYFALKLAKVKMADRFNISGKAGSYALNQSFKNVGELLKEAEAEVTGIFGVIPMGTADAIQILDLNFLDDGYPWTEYTVG